MKAISEPRMSAVRRKGEALFEKRVDPQDLLKQEQQVVRDATVAKTERLRALRLAKEAAEKADAPVVASRSVARKRMRRSKQT
jgi:hypothetical protein